MAGLAFAGSFEWVPEVPPLFRLGVPPKEGPMEESLKPGRDKKEHWEVAVSIHGEFDPHLLITPTLIASSEKFTLYSYNGMIMRKSKISVQNEILNEFGIFEKLWNFSNFKKFKNIFRIPNSFKISQNDLSVVQILDERKMSRKITLVTKTMVSEYLPEKNFDRNEY